MTIPILTADLEVPSWCSFRIPHSINVHLTYPAPPPTTLYGLVANALGMMEDDYSLMSELRFAVRIIEPGELVETYSNWQKWNPSKKSMYSLIIRQKMIKPRYRIYIQGKEGLLLKIEKALSNPQRILYLGESDDLVELTRIALRQAKRVEATKIDSSAPYELLKGIEPQQHEVSVIQWPIRFTQQSRKSYSVEYELTYVGKEIKVKSPIPCWELSEEGDIICLAGEGENE